MKFQLTILMLLVAGAYVDGVKSDLAFGKKYLLKKYGIKCTPRNCWTTSTASPCTSTTSPPAEDPCAKCPNLKINVYDKHITYTYPIPGPPCKCGSGTKVCGDGEIINKVTCPDDGSSPDDCICIPETTTTTTTTTEFYPE